MINAINMPNEIISAKAFDMSIGKHLPPRKSPTKTNGSRTVLPNPSCEASLLYFIIAYYSRIYCNNEGDRSSFSNGEFV